MQPETENIQASVTVDTGGVFWINSLGEECRRCGEAFQIPKKTIRADRCWRKVSEEKPISTGSRFSCLASEEEHRGRWRKEEHSPRNGMSRVILAMANGTPKGEGIRGQIVVDSGTADSVLPQI